MESTFYKEFCSGDSPVLRMNLDELAAVIYVLNSGKDWPFLMNDLLPVLKDQQT